jgi:hypothetical protein
VRPRGEKRVVFGKPRAGVLIMLVVCTSGASANIQLLAQILATPLKKRLGF